MELTERELLDKIVVAGRNLITVSRNVASTFDRSIGEEYVTMLTGPADALDTLLQLAPQPTTAWDGVFRNEDLNTEYFEPEIGGDRGEANRGCRITHIPTGLKMESYSKLTQADNRSAARSALAKQVAREWQRMGG